MYRLVVNPGTAHAWEIKLKSGVNTLGRDPSNEFHVNQDSVSSFHCQIVVSGEKVMIRDLGSTNGTFVERVPVQEAVLQAGQTLHLGAVQLLVERDEPGLVASAPFEPPRAPPIPPPHAKFPTGGAPQRPPLLPVASTAQAVCKYHPKSVARWQCGQCHKSFCDLCVTVRHEDAGAARFCRSCGGECLPLEVKVTPLVEKSFFVQVLEAFVYPLNGDGLILLGSGALFYAIILLLKSILRFAFLLGWAGIGILSVFGTGYFFCYLQRIMLGSAHGEKGMPDWPEFTDWGSCIRTPLLQFGATSLACFGPAIVCLIWAPDTYKLAAIPLFVLGALCYPMALLAVTMFDSLAALNPMLIVPSIFRVFLHYLIAWVTLLVIVGVGSVGKLFLPLIIPLPFLPALITGFLALYLWTVEVRILGLLYFANKHRLGWFNR